MLQTIPRFHSLDELAEALAELRARAENGPVPTSAKWSAGQICDHCARLVEIALDGTDKKLPWILRVIARATLLKTILRTNKPFKTGQMTAPFLIPDDGLPDTAGIDRLATAIDRVRNGEQMTHPSPLFGPLTHDQWIAVNLRHIAHHFQFIAPREA